MADSDHVVVVATEEGLEWSVNLPGGGQIQGFHSCKDPEENVAKFYIAGRVLEDVFDKETVEMLAQLLSTMNGAIDLVYKEFKNGNGT